MDGFLSSITDRLAALPGVEAVTLGGSRAQGTARPDSDWDLGIYYRSGFDPQSLRDVGWPGEVFELGGWGGGVFNGGAWLRIEGQPVDVHYRDLAVVEREFARANEGEFSIEPLMFHLAGIPTYLLVAELAINQVLFGSLSRVSSYPAALSEKASVEWATRASLHLGYAESIHQRTMQSLGLVTVAVTEYAHSLAALRGQWVTNEKRLLAQTGLSEVDQLIRLEPLELIESVRKLMRVP
jgi:hypothetical protein